MGRVFWWTLPSTYLAAGLIWGSVLLFTDYKMMPADYGGTIISSAILAYLIHLWVIPLEDIPPPETDAAPESPADSNRSG